MGKSSDDAFNDSLWCMTRYWPLEGISASLHYPRLHNVTKTQPRSWLHVWPVWSWKQWWVSGQEQIVFISGWGFELSVRGACSPHVWCDLVLDFSHASCCTATTDYTVTPKPSQKNVENFVCFLPWQLSWNTSLPSFNTAQSSKGQNDDYSFLHLVSWFAWKFHQNRFKNWPFKWTLIGFFTHFPFDFSSALITMIYPANRV